ncbi:hypothetical protein PVAP13_3KG402304 [Panicum virgatum]|uniref:Aminotransferase-like plant mobile domain-containing protein n=1 Tax=Panicum virgatum TaxID=38727 RepID=A0A8T0V6Q9_PANVG|nr:hypothetical protein PVAP13_3KG402304 [Panicum virgatum]
MAFRPATKIKNRIAWGLQLNSSKKDKEKTAASMDRIKRRESTYCGSCQQAEPGSCRWLRDQFCHPCPFGSVLWCSIFPHWPRWATSIERLTYPAFVTAFDQLTADRVQWNPYTAALTVAHAPRGLTMLCYRDQQYWFMKKLLVSDIFVEPYYVHRVMQQLGLRQEFPLPRE